MGLDLTHFKPIHKIDDDQVIDYFTLEELRILPGYIELQNQFIVKKDFDEFGKEDVIYFTAEGSQRKGMKASFFSDFKNDGLYPDLTSVKKAYGYLKADHISSLSELQANFQKYFIDNFIEGKSIFHVSW
jgi:uncharacterized membrane protein